MKDATRTPYPSEITREQFALIRPLLESARKKTKPWQLDPYDIFCAVLYILTEGCRWRSLPHDYPKWQPPYALTYEVSKEHNRGSLARFESLQASDKRPSR